MNDNLYDDNINNTETVNINTVPDSGANFSIDFGGFFWGFLAFLFVVCLLIIGSTFFIKFLRKRNLQKKSIEDWKQTVIFEIVVPNETAEQINKESGNSKREDKDYLVAAEQLFRVMSEYSKSGWKKWFFGSERFSLEIVNLDSEIRFWLSCSQKTSTVIERQILAVYPKANITKLDRTNLFKSDMSVFVQEIGLSNRYELPFKTYKDSDQDPLNPITNALIGINKDEVAAIQLVLEPTKDKWQSNPRILASKIQQGQSPKVVLFPEQKPFKIFVDIIKDIIKEFTPSSKSEETKQKKRSIDLTGTTTALNLTPQQQEFIKKLEEKSSSPGFYFTLRIVGASKDEFRSKQIVENIVPAFQIYDLKPINSLKRLKTNIKESVLGFLLRSMNFNNTDIINSQEITSIWHLPNHLVQTPNIKWLLARKPPIPLNLPEKTQDSIFLGVANARGQTRDVNFRLEDRFRHTYSIGGSGSGKSYLMTSVVIQDILAGRGVCVVDPHGETVDDILAYIPPERYDDVIIFSPSITDRPLGLNMLEFDPKKPTQKTLVTDTMFTIWDKLYNLKQTGGPMFEMYMKNSMRLVMGHQESGSTLMEIPKVLTDEDFRSFKIAMCEDREVIDFWEKEATKAGGEAALENMVPYITSKLAPFITNDFIRPMIGQQKSSINFREAMDNNKIVLVKLEKGMIGETSAYLVGMVIIGGILMAGMGRNDGLKYNLDGTTTTIEKDQRPPFFVFIDEMQNFLFDAIPKALEEIRKYKVGFYLAHQFVKQVVSQGDERIKDSIMANCASKFIFRVGADDAQYLEKEFGPILTPQDIMNPEARSCNAILLANGQKTAPFNFSVPAWPEGYNPDKRRLLLDMTKQKYGRNKDEVEKEIRDRAKLLF
jgi:hypothetical protein